jgi:hypothetical protein
MDPISEIIALVAGIGGITVVSMICMGGLALVITAAAILPFVFLIRAAFKRSAEIERNTAAATPARATIVNAESWSSEHSNRLNVKLVLDVQPPAGSVYRTETHWAVDYLAASRLQPGQSVDVRVNPAQPGLVYPGVPWATYTDSRLIRLSG